MLGAAFEKEKWKPGAERSGENSRTEVLDQAPYLHLLVTSEKRGAQFRDGPESV